MPKRLHIVIIGTGAAAHAMAPALAQHHSIVQVVGRDQKKVRQLAKKVNAPFQGEISDVIQDADVYLICVSDTAIAQIARKIKTEKGVVLHLSGATPLKALHSHAHAGVAWPVHSLGQMKIDEWKDVPILYESQDDLTIRVIRSLFKPLQCKLHAVTEEQRKKGHLSIVLLNNFIHHLAFKSRTLLKEAGLDKVLYSSLLQDTFEKLESGNLKERQTGPARRKDEKTLRAQQQLLKDDPELKKMYLTISQSIIKTYHS